jgi:hypothetical protein
MVAMADGEQSSTATLGRILSWIGYLWLVFAVLWGLGVAEAIGISGPFASSIGRSVFPAIILIGVGRVMRKRSQADPNQPQPEVSAPMRPTPPILPDDRPVFSYPPPAPPSPKPSARPAPQAKQPAVPPAEPVITAGQSDEPPPSDPGVQLPKHKSSQELIDEARQRWGSRP